MDINKLKKELISVGKSDSSLQCALHTDKLCKVDGGS